MKKKSLFLAGLLAAVMCVSSAACAEENNGSGIREDIRVLLEDGDLRDTLFGEDGLVSSLLPEGTDMQTLGEQVGLLKSQASRLVDAVRTRIDNADGSFDVSSLKEIAGRLVGAVTGFDMAGYGDFDAYFETYGAINDAMQDYYREKNAEIMDPADVQIMSVTYGYQDTDYDQPEFCFIPVLSQLNYSRDGDVLRFVSGASDVIMFTLSKAEDGTINILDAVYAEDGEGWLDSIRAMADAAGCPAEDILDGVDFDDYAEVSNMVSYLDEHEEIKGIEYMGEVRNRDELYEIQMEILDRLYPVDETEAESEDFSAQTEAE